MGSPCRSSRFFVWQNSTAGPSAKGRRFYFAAKLDAGISVETGLRVPDPKPRDLVLYQQLATLQLNDLEVIGRWMIHRFGDFVLQRPVLPFKF
jgi:hypothetical protein